MVSLANEITALIEIPNLAIRREKNLAFRFVVVNNGTVISTHHDARLLVVCSIIAIGRAQ